jgi:hypothetical protein
MAMRAGTSRPAPSIYSLKQLQTTNANSQKIMKTNIKKLLLAGTAVALVAPALTAANINLVTAGGNASIKLIQDRIPNAVLTGSSLTVNSTNSLIFRYTGTLTGTSKTVQWDFNLTGGAAAINDLEEGNNVTLADNTFAKPNSVISSVAPQTVALDPGSLEQDISLVVPDVFIKSNAAGNDLAGLTNITQRLAVYLEGSGGSLPTAYFGGNPANTAIPANALYFVGRNSSSAVRQVINANIYTTSQYNYTTNASGQPILYPGNPATAGAGSGTEVVNIVKVIPNSVGTVAAQDINGLPTLTYEGVAFSTANVINGSYPIWGYERYTYYPVGSGTQALTADQNTLFQALLSAVSDPTYDHSSSLFVGKFVSYDDLNAVNGRSPDFDGGPITSNVY